MSVDSYTNAEYNSFRQKETSQPNYRTCYGIFRFVCVITLLLYFVVLFCKTALCIFQCLTSSCIFFSSKEINNINFINIFSYVCIYFPAQKSNPTGADTHRLKREPNGRESIRHQFNEHEHLITFNTILSICGCTAQVERVVTCCTSKRKEVRFVTRFPSY